jgi:DNA-binding NarL/FixJ family response regulator
MSDPLKVLLIDDHPLFREGLRSLIAGQPAYTVLGEAGTAREALELARAQTPDIVVLDIGLPDADGIEVIRQLRAMPMAPRILVVSMHTRLDLVAESLRQGALGYVLKDSATASLVHGLDAVSRGDRYLDGAIVPQVLLKLDEYAARRSRPADPAYDTLTRREQQILRLLAEGRGASAIAADLYISRKTVENHRSNIFGKLGFSNMAELVHYAVRMGIIEVNEDTL